MTTIGHTRERISWDDQRGEYRWGHYLVRLLDTGGLVLIWRWTS